MRRKAVLIAAALTASLMGAFAGVDLEPGLAALGV